MEPAIVVSHEQSMPTVADAEDLTPFPHQVAGHFKRPIIRYRKKFILKPWIDDSRFLNEVEFYKETQWDESCLRNIVMHLPAFYGVMQVEDIPHLILEDLTAHYEIVNIMDIKVGGMPYALGAVSEEKWNNKLLKYPQQSLDGFRIAGMKVWSAVHHKYGQFNKSYIRKSFVTRGDGCSIGIACFFYNGAIFDLEALQGTIDQMRGILEWFKVQRTFQFYSSSLLLLHNPVVSSTGTSRSRIALDHADDRDEVPERKSLRVKVAMLDFAHTVKESRSHNNDTNIGNGADANYVDGLLKLVATLEALLVSMQTQNEKLNFEVKEHMSRCIF